MVWVGGTLQGVSLLKSVGVVTGSVTGTATYYFDPANYTIVVKNDGSNWFYYTPYTYPATVKAGSTGSIGSSTLNGLPATTGVYTVTSDSANSLLVSIIETTTYSFTSNVTTTVFRIDTVGAINLVSLTTDYYQLGTYYQTVKLTF